MAVPHDTSEEVLNDLRAAGYAPVPCQDPSEVMLITPQARVRGDMLLMSAMEALQGPHSDSERAKMVRSLWHRLNEKDAKAIEEEDPRPVRQAPFDVPYGEEDAS